MADNPQKTTKKKKNKPGAGRPTLYKREYCKKLIEYFSVEPFEEKEIVHSNSKNGSQWTDYKDVANPIRFLSQFAQNIGVPRLRLYEWAKVHPEFQYAITRARELREEMICVNALKGLYNPAFAMFYLKNRYEDRYKDKTEIDAKVKGEVTYREAFAKVLQKAKGILATQPPPAPTAQAA